jgi:lipid A ethanolaminephosphotransferase
MPVFSGLRAALAQRLPRLRLKSDVRLALAVSAIWLLAYNTAFWQQVFATMWRPSPVTALFIFSLGLALLYAQTALLLLIPTRWGLRAAASALFVIAAVTSYFSSHYGVIFDGDMIRNVAQTDSAEAFDLISAGLLLRTLLLGVIPAVLVWFVSVPPVNWRRQLVQRAVFIGGGAIVVLGFALATSASYATFLREHKPVRAMVSPAALVWNSLAYLASQSRIDNDLPRIDPGGAPQRVATSRTADARPLVVVFVVGETARAANFQLGGYARPTNPQLAARGDLFYFANATSCATATATSLPCMFSHLERSQFRVADARRYSNLLDLVHAAGVAVQWRDNNSGCKGLCERVPTMDFFSDAALRAGNALCSASHCYDEVLLDGLPEQLAQLTADSLFVLHQEGSHGPAYFERYPPGHEFFTPACRSADLSRCSAEQVIAAYDNTIRYTDHVLASLISVLEAAPVDALLVYASDHGESLGEGGIYLHGLPYTFAPPEQTHVPMMMWMSNGFEARRGVDRQCLAQATRGEASHDNLYHTVMGAVGVVNGSYNAQLDLLSRCLRSETPAQTQ